MTFRRRRREGRHTDAPGSAYYYEPAPQTHGSLLLTPAATNLDGDLVLRDLTVKQARVIATEATALADVLRVTETPASTTNVTS